jgi:hypothetical protein
VSSSDGSESDKCSVGLVGTRNLPEEPQVTFRHAFDLAISVEYFVSPPLINCMH